MGEIVDVSKVDPEELRNLLGEGDVRIGQLSEWDLNSVNRGRILNGVLPKLAHGTTYDEACQIARAEHRELFQP